MEFIGTKLYKLGKINELYNQTCVEGLAALVRSLIEKMFPVEDLESVCKDSAAKKPTGINIDIRQIYLNIYYFCLIRFRMAHNEHTILCQFAKYI